MTVHSTERAWRTCDMFWDDGNDCTSVLGHNCAVEPEAGDRMNDYHHGQCRCSCGSHSAGTEAP